MYRVTALFFGLASVLAAPAYAQGCPWVRVAADPPATECNAGTIPQVSPTDPLAYGVWCLRLDRHFEWYPPELGGRLVLEDIRWMGFRVTHKKQCS